MTDDLQPGQHLSPDQLSAFAENVLPEHERLSALAHLADCPDCRQVVFLLQQTDPSLTIPKPLVETPRRAWFSLPQIFVAATAALACSLILVLIVHHSVQNNVAAPVTTAQLQPLPEPMPQPPAPPASSQAPAKISSASSKPSHEPPEILYPPPSPPPPPPAQMKMPPPPTVLGGLGVGMATGRAAEHRSSESKMADKQTFALDQLSADDSGAGVPQSALAKQKAIPAVPTIASENRALKTYTGNGAVSAKDLPITGSAAAAPITLPPTPAPPPPSSSAETVSVSADAASMQTETLPLSGRSVESYDALAPGVAPSFKLPSKKPVAAQLNAGGRTLALDTAGALFLSYDKGKRWTAVKTQWSGKAVQLSFATTPSRLYQVQPSQTQTQTQQSPIPTSGFELTTATGAVWLSSDGLTWHPK
jgi:hypothetical protein